MSGFERISSRNTGLRTTYRFGLDVARDTKGVASDLACPMRSPGDRVPSCANRIIQERTLRILDLQVD